MNKLFFGAISFLALTFFSFNSLQSHEDAHKWRCCKVYAGFYTKDHVELNYGEAVPFDHNMDDIASTGGIIHSPGSCDITLRVPGIYRVTYSVSLKEKKGKLALTLDGKVIQGSEAYVGENEHLSTLSTLVAVHHSSCGQVLRLINNGHHEGWFGHDIKLLAGYDHQNVTASILIERIANLCSDTLRANDSCGNDPCGKDPCEDTHCCHNN